MLITTSAVGPLISFILRLFSTPLLLTKVSRYGKRKALIFDKSNFQSYCCFFSINEDSNQVKLILLKKKNVSRIIASALNYNSSVFTELSSRNSRRANVSNVNSHAGQIIVIALGSSSHLRSAKVKQERRKEALVFVV